MLESLGLVSMHRSKESKFDAEEVSKKFFVAIVESFFVLFFFLPV